MLLNIDNKIGIWSGGGLVDKFEVGDTVIIHNPKGKSTCNCEREVVISQIDYRYGACRIHGTDLWFRLDWLGKVDTKIKDKFDSEISLEEFL